VDTSTLAGNAELRPEMTMESASLSRGALFPSVFFVSPYLHNPETVRVSFSGAPKIAKCVFDAKWSDKTIFASIDLECDREVKRAILFADDLPVAQFKPSADPSKRTIHLLVKGRGSFTLKTDAEILTASRQFDEKRKKLKTTENSLISRNQADWEQVSIELAGEKNPAIEITSGKETLETSFDELAEKKVAKTGSMTVVAGANASIYTQRPFASSAISAKLALAAAKPDAWTRYWVQIECADGTVAESNITHPGMEKKKTVAAKLLRTPWNLDTKSGASGIPGMREFLTPPEEMPVEREEIAIREMDERIFRGFSWTNSENAAAFRLPRRRWPSGSYEISFAFTPKFPGKGKISKPIDVAGTMDNASVNLLDDGRLEIVRVSGVKSEGGAKEKLISKSALAFGKRHSIKIANSFDSLALYIDGKKDSSIPIVPQIRYGNCTATLNGVDFLEFTGKTQ
jgi:hypothetical protein